ncbi:MAG: MFS transporter [Thermoplasmata archaeon]
MTAYVLAVTAFAAAIPTPLYPVYEEQFHFTSGVLGLTFAAYTPGVFLTLFFVAPMAEHLGRKKLLLLGMSLTALGSLAFAFAPDVLWLAIARVILGLGVGSTTSVATAAMSDLEPRRDQHHVARAAVAANFGGFAIGALLSGLTYFAIHSLTIVYVLPLVASGLGAWAVHVTPETAEVKREPHRFRIQQISVPPELRAPFWVSVGGLTACYSLYGLFAALVPSYVRSGLGNTSPLTAGSIVALMFGMVAITQLATSEVRDRRALLIGLPLLFVTLVALVAILPLNTWGLLVVVTGALGLAVGLTFMGSVTLIDRTVPQEERGEILAGFYAAGYLALAVPTIGVAEASLSIGLANAGLLFGSILAVVVLVLFLQTFRTPTPPGGGGLP